MENPYVIRKEIAININENKQTKNLLKKTSKWQVEKKFLTGGIFIKCWLQITNLCFFNFTMFIRTTGG